MAGTDGSNGTNGTNGIDGAPGQPGPAGPGSEAYIGRGTATYGDNISGAGADVVSLSLPAGVYALFGKAELDNRDGDQQPADCKLSTGEQAIVVLGPWFGIADQQVVSVVDLLTLNAPGTVTMRCHTYSGKAYGANVIAIKVAVLHG